MTEGTDIERDLEPADRKDPDPFVTDLLVSTAVTHLGGLVVKVAKGLFSRGGDDPEPLAQQLARSADRLDSIVENAIRLVGEGGRRVLGGVLLLSEAEMARFSEMREALFQKLRNMDEISSRLQSA